MGYNPAMAKKQKPRRRKQSKPVQKTVSAAPVSFDRYLHILSILLEARESASRKECNAFYDLGSGERPQKVISEFTQVARQEAISVMITPVKGRHSLLLRFSDELMPVQTLFRVRSKSGAVVKEGVR